MMFPSHLAATLLAGLVLARLFPSAWGGKEWLLAIGFGVVIDLDHLLNLPRFMLSHPQQAFDVQAMMTWGAHWQGFMHTPWALLVVVGAMVAFRSWVPLAFWGLHMVQDFVIATRYVVFGSAHEWAVVAALASIITLFLYGEYLVDGKATLGFGTYVRDRTARGIANLQRAPAAAFQAIAAVLPRR